MREIAASLPRETSDRKGPSTSLRNGTEPPAGRDALEDNEGLSVKPRTACALIYANLFDDESEEIIPRVLRP